MDGRVLPEHPKTQEDSGARWKVLFFFVFYKGCLNVFSGLQWFFQWKKRLNLFAALLLRAGGDGFSSGVLEFCYFSGFGCAVHLNPEGFCG